MSSSTPRRNDGNSGNTKRRDSRRTYEISESHSRRPPHTPPKGDGGKKSKGTR